MGAPKIPRLQFVCHGIRPYNMFGHDFDFISIWVFDGELEVANAGFRITGKSIIAWDRTAVHRDYERIGVATAMYRWAEEITGKQARPSRLRTADAVAFWKGFRRKRDWKRPEWKFMLKGKAYAKT